MDNGTGTKFDEKYESIYQLDYEHSSLLDSLDYHGFKPEEITDLILTHLHFDHCGGTTYFDEEGELAHTFPNARYHVTKTHWETATHPNAREKASFFKENIAPLQESGQLHLIENNYTYEDGLSTLNVDGHTLGQQLPVIKSENTTLVFAADLFPPRPHVPLPWIMGYDMRPINTLEEKEEILNKAVEQDWYFFMEHDSDNEVIRIEKQDKKFVPKTGITLADF
ncbi:MAG: MBL fold metallo-hydrolase [Balneolaceae bacterium]|nr:MBL fold metallo-hydrolase [Balneolaceae bacterium]